MNLLRVGWRVLNCKFRTSVPYYITFDITNRCNSRCQTCGIWSKKGQEEPSLTEIRRRLSDIPAPLWITLGGGEPFLRDDLVDVVRSVKLNYPKVGLGISTNGLTPHDILKKTEQMISLGFAYLMVTVSMDGVEKVNDEIRGVEGGFHKALETYIGLREFERRHDNFKTGINYTISQHNVGRLREFCETVNPTSLGISLEHRGAAFQNVSEKIGYVNSDKEAVFRDLNYLLEHPELERGRIKHIFVKLAKKFVQNPSRMVLSCSAFKASCFIDASGDVFPCAIWGRKVGSLKKQDFVSIWKSEDARMIRKLIVEGKCPICFSGCDSTASILQSMPWALKELF